jgi:hypothetical protein
MYYDPTCLDQLNYKLRKQCDRLDLKIESIGKLKDEELLLITPSPKATGPRILVAAGFHGEEPAGCWGILKFLEENDPRELGVKLSFLPIVNPTGIKRGKRKNIWGERTNCGFCQNYKGLDKPSHEGKIILKNLPRILELSSNAFISLHEDGDDYEKFYVYSFEQQKSPGAFTKMLLSEGKKFFEIMQDRMIDDGKCLNGSIFNFNDGSLENCLFNKGVPFTASTETPTPLPLQLRIDANANLIKATCEFVKNNYV